MTMLAIASLARVQDSPEPPPNRADEPIARHFLSHAALLALHACEPK